LRPFALDARIAKRCRQMSRVLGMIAKMTQRATTLEELRREVQKAEEVMTTENQEWSLMLNFRQPVLTA
jgi:hypothetical protein